MNRGVARVDIFRTATHGQRFVRCLGEAIEQSELELHAYCLMPNHFHLLVRGPGPDLSQAMQRLGTNYCRYFNRSVGRDGPLFRSRFTCKPLHTNKYVIDVSRYIHRNPIGRVNTGGLDRYRWSSLQYYAGVTPAPAWLSVATILDEVGGPAAYRDIVTGGS